MRAATLLAAFLLSILSCGADTPTSTMNAHVKARVAAEVVVAISGIGPSGIVVLTSAGQVWLRNDDLTWTMLPHLSGPFVSITGTPQGKVYAVDASGQIWRFFGDWVTETGPSQ